MTKCEAIKDAEGVVGDEDHGSVLRDLGESIILKGRAGFEFLEGCPPVRFSSVCGGDNVVVNAL